MEQLEQQVLSAELERDIMTRMLEQWRSRNLDGHAKHAAHWKAMREQHAEIVERMERAAFTVDWIDSFDRLAAFAAAVREIESAMLDDRSDEVTKRARRSRFVVWLRRVFKIREQGFSSTRTCTALDKFRAAIEKAKA